MAIGVAVAFVVRQQQRHSIPMPDDSMVELTAEHEGTTYKLVDGDLYRVASADRLEFVEKIYEPNFREQNYTEADGQVWREDRESGQRFRATRNFAENFENADRITDLIGVERGWNAFTLQSPRTSTVPEYVQLRNRILQGQADFIDNRVEPSSEVVHSGARALKCFCLPPSGSMTCGKSSLSMELLYFHKGDDVWYSGWYFIAEGGMPLTLMDLETTWIKEHPGIRIMIEDGVAMFELKWAVRPKYRQPVTSRVSIPVGRWVHLKACLRLSEKTDGRVQLWQDGQQLLDERGQTLPLAGSVYDSLEVGISAHSFGPEPATVYVDDVVISDQPIDSLPRAK